ncbi:hypothetical protein EYF80_001651 [Liparis tanakae]|uniref:Uncharacterized protein n=1 Tax=Liparis tanakae TaxID=230148 RepID=A0A4Z2JD27_9TELE|nr:hypothetical protein EYF80_001651 [Liparis tanakae]
MRELAALRRGSVKRVHDNNLPPSRALAHTPTTIAHIGVALGNKFVGGRSKWSLQMAQGTADYWLLFSIMVGVPSIRDVIDFLKSFRGHNLMS